MRWQGTDARRHTEVFRVSAIFRNLPVKFQNFSSELCNYYYSINKSKTLGPSSLPSSSIRTLTSQMASSFLPRLLKRRSMAATSSLRHLHALPSFHNLHFSSCPSHALNPNPNSNSSLPKIIENEPSVAFSSHSFTVYPTFPHCSHLDPVSLFEASKGCLVGAQSTSLTTPNPSLQLKFDMEPNFGISFSRLSNVDPIPLPEAIGLEIEREKEIVIIADSVKKKRKRKDEQTQAEEAAQEAQCKCRLV